MKIAYIVDASTKINNKIKYNENIYTLPFKMYDQEGQLENIYDTKTIELAMSNKDGKIFIEPTPGMYRDLFNELKNDNYEFIVCIPQSKKASISFTNAQYAMRATKANVNVIDCEDVDITPSNLLLHLIKDEKLEENKLKLIFDLDTLTRLFNAVMDQFKKVNLVLQ